MAHAYGIYHYSVGTESEMHILHRFSDEDTRARWKRMFDLVNGTMGLPSSQASGVEFVTEDGARAQFPDAFSGVGTWEGKTMYVPTEYWTC